MTRSTRWYYGWNIIALVVVAQMFVTGLPINCLSLFLNGWSQEFNRPVSDFALAQTIFAMVCTPLAPLSGWASDRFAAQRVFGFGLLLVAVFFISMGYATSQPAILLLFALVGSIGVSFSGSVPSQAVVARWYRRRRGLAMGLTAFGLALAGVVFPPIVAYMINTVRWRDTWIYFGIFIGVILLPIIVLLLRDQPAAGKDFGYLGEAQTSTQGQRNSIQEILRRPNFWRIGIAFFCLHGVNLAVATNLSPLVQSRGFSFKTSAILISCMSIAALVGKIGCGILADRFGNRPPFILIGLLSAASVGLLAVAHDFTTLTFIFIALGMVQGVWPLAASATAAEFGPESFGQAFGLIVMFCSTSSFSSWAFARLNEHVGNYGLGLLILAAASLVGTGAILRLSQDRKAPPRSASSGAVPKRQPV